MFRLYEETPRVPESSLCRRQTAAYQVFSLVLALGCSLALQGQTSSASGQPSIASLQQRAARGDRQAEEQLAEAYLTGRGVTEDRAKARAWMQKAAEHGYVEAQNMLALMLTSGTGGSVDFPAALHWAQLSADQGSADGLSILAGMYFAGQGVPADETKGITLWERAAEKGQSQAELILGSLYIVGEHAPKDLPKARRLLESSLAQGNLGAKEWLDSLDKAEAAERAAGRFSLPMLTGCAQHPDASRCPSAEETLDWLNAELKKTGEPFILNKDRLWSWIEITQDRKVLNWGIVNLHDISAITTGVQGGSSSTSIRDHSFIVFWSPSWQKCTAGGDCQSPRANTTALSFPSETDWTEFRQIYQAFRYLASIQGSHFASSGMSAYSDQLTSAEILTSSFMKASSFQEALEIDRLYSQAQQAADRRERAQEAASQAEVDDLRRAASSAKSPSMLDAVAAGLQQASDDLAQQNAAQQPKTDAGWQAAQDLVNANDARRAAAAAAQQRKNSGSSTPAGVCPNGKLVDDAAQCDCRAHSANGVYSCPR